MTLFLCQKIDSQEKIFYAHGTYKQIGPQALHLIFFVSPQQTNFLEHQECLGYKDLEIENLFRKTKKINADIYFKQDPPSNHTQLIAKNIVFIVRKLFTNLYEKEPLVTCHYPTITLPEQLPGQKVIDGIHEQIALCTPRSTGTSQNGVTLF